MARRFSYLLPVDWWRIPLINEQSRAANIEHMVDHYVRKIDETAQLRHDLRQMLNDSAEDAVQLGGLVMALYMNKIGDVPVTATMTCYDISAIMALPEELDPAKILAMYVGDQALDESLPDLLEAFESAKVPLGIPEATEVQALPPRPQTEEIPWDKVTDFDIVAYRRTTISPGTDFFSEDAPKTQQLHVTYMQAVKDFGLVQTVFSTPLIQAKDAWITMFDAMVAGFRAGAPDDANSTDSSEIGNEV